MIRILIVAFYESVAQGFLNLFVPFYFFVYVIIRWDNTNKWFMKYLGGIGIQIVGGLFMGLGWLLGFDWPEDTGEEVWRRLHQVPTAVACVQSDYQTPVLESQGAITRSFSSAV